MERLFNFSLKKFGSKPCLGTREVLGEVQERQVDGKEFTKLQLGDYTWQSYSDLNTKAEHFGKGLRELGVEPRDKIVLYANTCADWMVSAMASFKHSLAVVTIYTNLGQDGVEHGISQTNASTVIASQDLVPRLLSVLPKCSSVKNIIIIPNHNSIPSTLSSSIVTFHQMSEVISLGSNSSIHSSPPSPTDTAIIMYTSGSTGVPKGVVLTHSNLVHSLYSLIHPAFAIVSPIQSTDCYIAMLPLAHVLELLAENLMLVLGIPIGYSSPKTFTDSSTGVAEGSKGDATLLKPSLICVVPLLLDTIYKGIKRKVAARGPFFSQLVDLCYRYRMKWVKRGLDTPIMNRIIFSKFKTIVGGNVRSLICGGAPLAPAVHDYSRVCLGVTLLQGYGLTETCGGACLPDTSDLSTGRVGPPLQGVDIRLVNWDEGGYTVTDQQGPRGEIVIGGEHLAKEYYGMPDKTREDFFTESGKRWFKTGDIGHLRSDGCIQIIDRKKDLVKLQNGEYVSLGKVESLLKIHPAIENICVSADSRKNCTVALVIPGQVYLDTLATELGLTKLDRESLCQNEKVVENVLHVLSKHGVSQRLEKFEIPKAVYLVSEPWTPESGLLTAAMKLKRRSLEAAFAVEILEMYSGNNNLLKGGK
eukprot:GFUD01018258.1.p1 GENE.GFUD01018258.1~~GFUD01018258.1.p1  ORF type:complete len:731 (+),score=161.78 GFUD01018258.1:266-2194(+)